ncbi:MAG: hypothetical protein QHH13_08335 [Melioribacter sp.]|nr:hypothetical protein [Melioribacter sp.]
MIVSYCGIFIDETYIREVKYYAVQGIGQDIVNLLIVVPLLIITSLRYTKSKSAMLIWSGVILYLIYSYAIYCFSMHFNFLFLAYCVILGLSFYSFVYFIFSQINEIKINVQNFAIIKATSVFLIILAILFYFLWLSEIIPAIIKNEIPKSILENGILTNPVHVLDISIFLPAFIITAIMLIKKREIGYLLAPAMLIFGVLMSIAIIGMVIVMYLNKLNSDLFIITIFILIALIGGILLKGYLRNLEITYKRLE